jgi:hypothetical protein
LLHLGDPPTPEDYTDLFAFQLYPYASVYLGAEGMLGGEARDRIAGFWRALGGTPPHEPDHIAVLLAFYADAVGALEVEADAQRRLVLAHARQAFLWEHLLSWLPFYLDRLVELAAPTYAKWGELLHDALLAEAASSTPPSEIPLHLRHAPPVARRVETLDEVLQLLLAPVRSGVIVTRADLRRAAEELGLGLRVGERRFILQALFHQDAPAVLEWLRDEALTCAKRHAAYEETLPGIGRYWTERARATAGLLGSLLDKRATAGQRLSTGCMSGSSDT